MSFAYTVTSAGVSMKIQHGFVSEEKKTYSEEYETPRCEYLQQQEDSMVWAHMQERITMDRSFIVGTILIEEHFPGSE
jgi:hypothetical protein